MVTRDRALLARNVEYSAGSMGARHGYAGIQALPSNIAGIFELYNWIAPFSQISANYADNAVVIVSNSPNVRVYNLNTTTSSGLMAGATFSIASGGNVASTVIGVGMRLYISHIDSSQHGLDGGESLTIYNNAGAVGARGGGFCPVLFGGPCGFSPAITEPGAGLITVGTHRFGYLIEYTDGFTTRVSPDNSFNSIPTIASFVPVSLTAAGSKSARLTFTNGWNSASASGEMLAVSVVMTTTTNLNQYYIVPGSRTLLASVGATTAFNIDVSISDSDLSSQGVDATPWLYWLTASPSASQQPFLTKHIALWGNRMAYLGRQADNNGSYLDTLYVSEPNNFQAITADQHLLQLPGQRPMMTMFRMGSVNYIVGPHEIWGTTDNGDVPVSWASPQLIDGRHGTQSIHGVEVAPSGNYAWLADQGGLYLFTGGPITSLPLSYYQSSDWNRINWAKAYCVKIRDDASNKRVHVMVPLDGATSPSHIMTWDYTNGATPAAVMYSLDNISGYSLGAMDLVRNDLLNQATGNAGKVELWLASSGTDRLLRKTSDADSRSFTRAASTLTSISVTTNTATATTSAAHGLHVGQSIVVAGATVDTDLNATYAIATVPTSTTFTFTTVNVTGAPTVYTESTLGITVSPYQDNGAAISSVYRTAPLPGRGLTQGHIQLHHGFHARLKGSGTISPTVYDIDGTRNFPCSAQTLSTAPDQDTLVFARMRNELAFVEFSQNAINQNWVLSYLKWYYSEYLAQR